MWIAGISRHGESPGKINREPLPHLRNTAPSPTPVCNEGSWAQVSYLLIFQEKWQIQLCINPHFKRCQPFYRQYLNRTCPYIQFAFYVSRFQPLFSFLKHLTTVSRNLLSETCIATHELDMDFAACKRYRAELAKTIYTHTLSSCLEELKSTWWLKLYGKFHIFHLSCGLPLFWMH